MCKVKKTFIFLQSHLSPKTVRLTGQLLPKMMIPLYGSISLLVLRSVPRGGLDSWSVGVSRSSSSMLSRLLLSVVCDVWDVWCSGCGAPGRSTPCWAAAAAGIPASGSPPGRIVSSLVSSGSYREEPIIGGQGCTQQGAWLCNSGTELCNHYIITQKD